jgi:hypothetical protein
MRQAMGNLRDAQCKNQAIAQNKKGLPNFMSRVFHRVRRKNIH